MSTHQVVLKPINEVAKYLKNLIPANIPETYALKPIFKNVADEKNIRNGVVAFRKFLYLFFDRLITDGHLYAKPPKKPSGMTDYPFLHNVTNLLVDIGYHSKLVKNSEKLMLNEIPSCNSKIPVSTLIECLRFLTLCGFVFNGIDLEAKTFSISKAQPMEVSYPKNPILLTGLKALSIADMELRTTRRYWNDNNLLRCDYRLLKAENTDIFDILKDFLYPLPKKIQNFALKLHQRYVDMGLTCTLSILDDTSFSYAYISESSKGLSSRDRYQKRIWAFSYSIRNGYCLFVRAKKTDKYTDAIKKFTPSLQEKIAIGYGCYRKLGRERCQGDCQGICIPLDESILNISSDIQKWLDLELPSLQKTNNKK